MKLMLARLYRPDVGRRTAVKSVVLVQRPGGDGLQAEVVDMERPVPGPAEMVVDMKACGLCGTDMEKIRGEYTASMPVIGHEAVGRVSALGEGVSAFRVGDPVFPHHHVPCRECHLCNAGSETMCDRYRSSNISPGGFSESFLVPRWNVEKGGVLVLPHGMDFEVASLIEPVACCLRALGKCRVMQDDSVLVAGAGPAGMMHALLLQEIGAKVMVSDVSEGRLRFAEREGAGAVIDARRDVPGEVKSLTGGRGADIAIVATGSRDAVLQGLRSVRKGGEVCLFGVPPKKTVLDYDVSVLYNQEQRILTSYAATETDTKAALRVLSANAEVFGRLITDRFPLTRFSEAVATAARAERMKVVVTP